MASKALETVDATGSVRSATWFDRPPRRHVFGLFAMIRMVDYPTRSTSTDGRATPLTEYIDRYHALAVHRVFSGPRYRIGYTLLGDGPPVYVVPGICSTRLHFAPLAVELAQSFRTVLYDLPGIDPRDGSKLSRYALEDYARDLTSLADHLGDAHICVIGISFGVATAVQAMVDAPDRITRAMLVAGFARRPLGFFERLSLNLLQHWPGRIRHIPFMQMVSKFNHARELDAREPGLHDFLFSQAGQTPVRTTAAQVRAVDRVDLRELLPKVTQPVMVVHGTADRLVPTHHAGELTNRLNNVQIVLIPRCGHIPQLSHPEFLAHAAQRFFSESD
jgi:pimeloyl-ACP methyl ester carboxylesterase